MSVCATEDKSHVWTTGFLQCCISWPRSDSQRRHKYSAPRGRSSVDRRRSAARGSIRTSRLGSGSSASTKAFHVGISQPRSSSGSAPDQATQVFQIHLRDDENGFGQLGIDFVRRTRDGDAADNARNQRNRPAPGRVVGARRARSTAVHPVRNERCRRRKLQYSNQTLPKGRR